jgi:hypothetical protein
MGKSIRDIKKAKPKRGRPVTTGSGQPFLVRMHDRQVEAIDGWIAAQDSEVSRPEAIRRLLEQALDAAEKKKVGKPR